MTTPSAHATTEPELLPTNDIPTDEPETSLSHESPGHPSDDVQTPPDGPPVRAKTLRGLLVARELDSARTAHGLTTRRLAAQMSMSAAMLNRVMTGRRTPTALEIGALCALLDIDPTRRQALYRLTTESARLDWLHNHTADNHPPLAEVEALAESITSYHPTHIPPPLRIPDYHQALRDPTPIPGNTNPHTTYLIPERVLTDPTIPATTMAAQRRHLTTFHATSTTSTSSRSPTSASTTSASRSTTMRVIPTTAPPPPPTPFRVLTIPHFRPIVHLELHGTTLLLESPAATTPYIDTLTTLLTHCTHDP